MASIIRNTSGRRLSTQISEVEDRNYARFLSGFQIEKFTYMFKKFFDSSADKGGDGVIDKADVEDFLERMRIFRDFSATDPRYVSMKDVLFAFYDCLKDQVEREIRASTTSKGFDNWSDALAPRSTDHEVTLNQWLNMWGRLCRGAAGISGFPFWVQLLGHIFFDALDHNSDGVIDFAEYKRFYTFVGVKSENLDKVADEGYRSLTANRGYVLNRENFLFGFANFLLGRDIYGPGKYIFGVFDNRELDQTFKVRYNEEDE